MFKEIDNTYQNAKFIFPQKQRAVGDIVRISKEDENIKKIIIFGSSVTPACNPWSDIDVYFEIDEDKPLPVFGNRQSYDKWTNFSVSDELKKEIDRKGVIVYERKG